MFSKPKKLTSSHIKLHVSLSHITTRHGYDFLSYFPHEFLMSFRNMYAMTQFSFESEEAFIALVKTFV